MTQSIVHLREGALDELAAIVSTREFSNLFLVVDSTAYEASGASKVVAKSCAGRQTTEFTGFHPNPKIEDVERGIGQLAAANADVVVAVGGGTAIDLAKAIARLSGQDSPVRDVVTGSAPLTPNGLPLIAVPTTAGSGSESTHFAVVYVDQVKYSIAHRAMRPDVALIDPLLTHSLPPAVTAASGLDALCQAAESFWAVGATDDSIRYADRALQLAVEHLEAAVNCPTAEARRGMSEAAHLAGRAINLGKTTAPHALSYAITVRYGVPHGFAVALTLSLFLRYNAQVDAPDCVDPRGHQNVRRRIDRLVAALGCHQVEEACQQIDKLIERVGGVVRLSQIGIDNDQAIEWLANEINTERLANNPRQLERNELDRLLRSIR